MSGDRDIVDIAGERRPNMKFYIALDEKDLRAVLRGESVVKLTANGVDEVEIILKDIGWGRIFAAVQDARENARRERD